MERLSPWNMGT